MTLRATPGRGQSGEYVSEHGEQRSEGQNASRNALPSHDLVYVCSWCGRIRQGDSWNKAEKPTTEHRYVLSGDAKPKVSHGICDACAASLIASLPARCPSP
jgi:hypothetical protein